MAACGALTCDEEKVDKPKRLFNYKPAGVKSPEYMGLPEAKSDSLEEYVANGRKGMDEIMGPMKNNQFLADAMEKNVTTKLTVKNGKISDGDITVYMHRPRTLPEKGCAAMIFAHGGGSTSGSAEQHIPVYALVALHYEVVGFNVDYRLAPEHGNKGGSDVYAALKYVYENAEKLGIDKSRIGMEGTSAGVHQIYNACNLMAQNGETRMCKMIISDIGMLTSVLKFTPEKDWEGEELVAGPYLDFMYEAMFGDKFKEYIANKDPMLFPELVEEDKLAVYPPVAIFSAEFCPMHKGNKLMAKRLDKVGKLLEFRLVRGLGHMYGIAVNDETTAVFQDRILCVDVYLKK